jgi:lambda family phage tail tape measure protein
MAAIENFVLKIKVEGQKAVDDLKKSISDLGKETNNFDSAGGKMSSVISGIVGSVGLLTTGALAAGAAFVGMGMKALTLADDLGDISDATGVAAGALNNFRNSLVLAGGKADDMATLAAKLNQNVGDAAVGGEKAQKAFQKLGVYVTDAGGAVRNTGDILRDAIAKLAAIEDPATRAALAVDIFGKTANKLDFTKLNAVNDPFKDEQVKQLGKYKDAIDAMANAANDRLLTVFGKIAIAIENSQKAADAAEKSANERGKTIVRDPRLGTAMEVDMTAKQKSRLDLEQKLSEAYKDQGREMSRLQSINKPASVAGGYGATPEATLKAIAESEKRLRESNIASNKNLALRGANDIMAIEINAAAEIARAREEIFSKERLTNAQKSAEFAGKKKEIETKAAIDTAKARNQLNAKIYAEEEAQRQKFAEELAAEETRIGNIVAGSLKIVDEIANQNKEMAAKAKFALDAATMTDTERANAQALFDIEQQRLALLREIANIKDLPYAERLAAEKKVNDLLNQRKTDALVAQNEQKLQREDFNLGWEKSYRQYIENSTNAAQQGQQAFETLSRGFEDAFTRMFRSGEASFKNLKSGFKDLANSMIADFVRIQAQSAFKSIFGAIFGGGVGSITAAPSNGMFGGSLLGLPGYASGGNISAGQLSMVGERGPELFLPKQAGTIIPNNMLGGGQTNNTAVTYNIQAVDASSFRSMLARDPEFIHNVAEQGRRQLPIRSRR